VKILLTGSSGFLGRNISQHLSEIGHEVISPRSPGFYPNWNFLDAHSHDNVIYEAQPEVIVHSAWGTELVDYRHSDENDIWRNATVNFYIAASKFKVKQFIALGTFSENSPDIFSGNSVDNSLYAKSKRQTRDEMFQLGQQLEIITTWLRIQYPYGYWDKSKRLLPMMIDHALIGKDFSLQNPHLSLDFVFALDIASAVAKAISFPRNGIHEIQTGVRHEAQDVQSKIREIIRNKDFEMADSVSLKRLFLSDLGENLWKPKVPLDLGLRATICRTIEKNSK
jgi:nucleoside-diphosphate-sugar epimerase